MSCLFLSGGNRNLNSLSVNIALFCNELLNSGFNSLIAS